MGNAIGVVFALFALVFILFIVYKIADETGKAAERKGYSYGAWFMAGLFFNLIGYIIALMFLSALPDRKAEDNRRKRKEKEHFECPECGEDIKKVAKICHYCHAVITEKDKKILNKASLR